MYGKKKSKKKTEITVILTGTVGHYFMFREEMQIAAKTILLADNFEPIFLTILK